MVLNVIYEDNHILVVEKPAGILSQGGYLDLDNIMDIVKAYLKEKYQKPGKVFLGLVHRLDTNVGGLMVFAKTSKAASRLSADIRNLNFEKKYMAVVRGALKEDSTIELIDYLDKDEINKIALIKDELSGKKSVLRFKVLKNEDNLSLIDIELETGRFHQIRCQLANYGHPIYNDYKYNPKDQGYNLGLYAYRLGFNHPISKERLTFTLYPNKNPFSLFKDTINKFEVKV
jgi:23S rRNA pseudouridine1911/1915/1917 synthase